MRGYKTSFVGMFEQSDGVLAPMHRIEIPLIQRDYAQGRDSAAVEVIRRDFLSVLVAALTGGDPVELDFIYGEIEAGTLRLLDGQQRLTTLFLLHWYVAAQTGRLTDAAHFLKFAYATRPTAELFCRRLVDPAHALTEEFTTPSEWITDQAWYLYAWRHDPTVQAMLLMLDAIHDRLGAADVDLDRVWLRLVDTTSPSISFYFLPIDDMPSGEELYIKMNSRGKPLTEFENFKARLEKLLAGNLHQSRFDDIVHKLDGVWTDILWRYHGGDYIIDDEFLRYFEFIIEICEWRDGEDSSDATLLERTERALGSGHPSEETNLAFLIHAFDTWVGVEDIGDIFNGLLVNAPGADGAAERGLITLFDSPRVNLFEESLQRYGLKSGRNRLFSLTETLFLFAVLIHRQFETDEIGPRLRILRNLTDTAGDEIREARMNDLIASVEQLIRHGSLDGLRGFSPDRIQDEQDKRVFIGAHPELELTLYTLEDHVLLRGRVFAFELEATTFPSRAEAFRRISDKSHWPALTAALLANGNYGYDLAGGRAFQFGTGAPTQENRWRDVLNHYGRAKNSVLRESLGSLLDEVAASDEEPAVTLERITHSFSETRRSEQRLDWRYYLVTYPAMREGETGIYYGEHLLGDGGWGYSMCMLRTQSLTGGAHYRDPYLLAMYQASGLTVGIDNLWFSGYESSERWLRLSTSGAGIRCVNNGFELDPPLDDDLAAAFLEVCQRHGAPDTWHLPIPQSLFDDELIDTEDRVQKGASLLQDLIEAGL